MNDGDTEVGMVNVGDVHPSMYQEWLFGDRMVIDSLSSLVIKYGIDATLGFLREARREIRETNANIMFPCLFRCPCTHGYDQAHAYL